MASAHCISNCQASCSSQFSQSSGGLAELSQSSRRALAEVLCVLVMIVCVQQSSSQTTVHGACEDFMPGLQAQWNLVNGFGLGAVHFRGTVRSSLSLQNCFWRCASTHDGFFRRHSRKFTKFAKLFSVLCLYTR